MPTFYFVIYIDVVNVGDSRPAALADIALDTGWRYLRDF